MRQALRVARYRFRPTFRRQWAGLLSLALLIGLVGGLALGALAGARRTQSSYPAYLASTDPSDLTVLTALSFSHPGATGYDAALVSKIARLPHVAHVESYAGTNAALLGADGRVLINASALPALGINASLHTEMGTGAYLASTWLSEGAPAASGGPNEVLVRLRPGASAATERRKLQQLVPAANGGEVSAVQRPAEIVNYRTMGTTPALLGVALAVGAFVALGLTLYASVRRRRRELALLKTLGFTRRQLAATVAWQASVAVVLGIVVGVPLGAITGRLLWDQFANALHVVSEPTVPALTVVLIALGALVLANVVAAVPGRAAARTRTAELLRSE